MHTLDLDFVRARFPGLGDGWAYFDNAGGSHVLAGVADRVRDFLLTSPVQHGASYAPSVGAAERLTAATRRLAGMINAAEPAEVVLGPSATALFQTLARALAPSIREGDEIVVTDVDHESNVGPWRDLERLGASVREWRVNRESLALEPDDLKPLLTERTRLVCVTHCSNVLGTILDVPEVARLVHAVGAELCVDGVAYAPHRRVDVRALGCDWYCFALYKTYGPHQALLWGHGDRLRALPSQNHFFIGRDQVPYKLQPGNVNYELAYGAAGVADYLDELGAHQCCDPFEAIARHEERLAERLLGHLTARNDVRIVGERTADRARRVPTVAFTVDGRRPEPIVAAVDRHRVGIRHGDFYAKRLVRALGLEDGGGVVRVSMVHYNTIEEVDRLIAALDEALAARPAA